MKGVLLILSLHLTSSINAQNLSIKGKIIDRTTNEPIANGIVKLYFEDYSAADTVKGEYYPDAKKNIRRDTLYIQPKLRPIDSAYSNSNGEFSIPILNIGSYYVYCKIKIDTIGYRYDEVKHVLIAKNSVLIELKPQVYCEYSKYRNQNFCPVCSKKDSLLKVIYGLPMYDSNDPTKIAINKNEYWIGYCDFDNLCHARWFCSRCDKLF